MTLPCNFGIHSAGQDRTLYMSTVLESEIAMDFYSVLPAPMIDAVPSVFCIPWYNASVHLNFLSHWYMRFIRATSQVYLNVPSYFSAPISLMTCAGQAAPTSGVFQCVQHASVVHTPSYSLNADFTINSRWTCAFPHLRQIYYPNWNV